MRTLKAERFPVYQVMYFLCLSGLSAMFLPGIMWGVFLSLAFGSSFIWLISRETKLGRDR